MSMTHNEQIDRLLDEMARRGVGKFTVAPPLYRLLWRIGFEVPPPLFQGFFSVFLGMGTFFGIFWGTLMCLLRGQAQELSPMATILQAVFTGGLFGVAMAAYYRWKARRGLVKR
jgi:hypothetical protein